LFDTLGCTHEQRARYIGLKLTGEAGRWWTSKKVLLTKPPNETIITWDLFKVEYNRRFFPRAQRQLRAIEFQNLVQGDMTVEQYSARFIELARFAANLIPNEESKAERFGNGLNPHIKERVICLKIKDYARLVEVASLAERGIRELAAANDLKRRLKQQTLHSEKRPAIEYDSKPDASRSSPPVSRNQKSHCNKCGKPHMGDCRMGSPNCFKCGKPGHFLKSCPMNPAEEPRPQGGGYKQQEPAQARLYSLVLDDVDREEFADMKIDAI
jgi:hypothetical protein